MEADLRGCLKWTFKILKLAGYWFPRNLKTLYTAYAIPMVCYTIIVYMCTEVAYLIFVIGQLEEMANSLFILLIHAAQGAKIVVFIARREKIYGLLDCMEEKVFKPKNSRQLKKTMETVHRNNIVSKIFMIMVISTVVLWCILPLLGNNKEKQLPFRAWYPFDVARSPQYEAIYIYQCFTVMLCACANAALDITAATFISQICIQLDILDDSILYIKESAEAQVQSKTIANKNCIAPEIENKMRTILVEWVKHHLKLLSFAKDVQLIFGVPVFSQFLVGVGAMCMTLFEMTLVPINSIPFLSMVLYEGCMFLEIGMSCWYGNEIILKSQKLAMSVYNSEWLNCSIEYKKIILFVMVNIQQQLKVRVGGFVDLSLQNLILVLRSACSYFLVLYNMHYVN